MPQTNEVSINEGVSLCCKMLVMPKYGPLEVILAVIRANLVKGGGLDLIASGGN